GAVVRAGARHLLGDRVAAFPERVAHQAAGADIAGQHDELGVQRGDRTLDLRGEGASVASPHLLGSVLHAVVRGATGAGFVRRVGFAFLNPATHLLTGAVETRDGRSGAAQPDYHVRRSE